MVTEDLAQREPQPIGGWLLLVGLSLIVSPILTLSSVAGAYPSLFIDGGWERLTVPGTAAYNALWAPLLVFDMFFGVVLSIAAFVLFYLFVEKSHRFPRLYVAWLVTTAAYMILVELVMAIGIPAMAELDSGSARDLARALIACAIWIPYMSMSTRVKNTFVRNAA